MTSLIRVRCISIRALYSYKLTFDFPTDAGILNYLRGRSFQVERVPFREKYFG